jgi:hypothetical protein
MSSTRTTHVEVKLADLPAFKAFMERVAEFVTEYAWHDVRAFHCNPDPSCGAADEPEDDAYPTDSPKHPQYHACMSDLWDLRERG